MSFPSTDCHRPWEENIVDCSNHHWLRGWVLTQGQAGALQPFHWLTASTSPTSLRTRFGYTKGQPGFSGWEQRRASKVGWWPQGVQIFNENSHLSSCDMKENTEISFSHLLHPHPNISNPELLPFKELGNSEWGKRIGQFRELSFCLNRDTTTQQGCETRQRGGRKSDLKERRPALEPRVVYFSYKI